MSDLVMLSRLTTLAVGGNPVFYRCPHGEGELRDALAECGSLQIPWRALGGGSNVLADEGPLPYGVIHIVAPEFAAVERLGAHGVRVGAGARTSALLAFCRARGLAGLEFLAGIPGTVGGAVAGNAGAWGHAVGERVSRVRLMRPDGATRLAGPAEMAFSYRHTETDGCVIVEVDLDLEPCEPALIARRMAEHALERAARHPAGFASAGCIFKNPPGESAGKLLDRCGMKGRRVGAAAVSEVHANFILNTGGASAGDVVALIEDMRGAVRTRFGVELELEVRRWSASERAA